MVWGRGEFDDDEMNGYGVGDMFCCGWCVGW